MLPKPNIETLKARKPVLPGRKLNVCEKKTKDYDNDLNLPDISIEKNKHNQSLRRFESSTGDLNGRSSENLPSNAQVSCKTP